MSRFDGCPPPCGLRPDIVEAILDGQQPAEMTLALLMKPFPVAWGEQAETLSQSSWD